MRVAELFETGRFSVAEISDGGCGETTGWRQSAKRGEGAMKERAEFHCEDVWICLDDYLDQELPLDETFRLLQHLDQCPDCAGLCQRAYENLAKLRQALQRFEPPDGLMERIHERLSCVRLEEAGETGYG
jgi:hypothetical protein